MGMALLVRKNKLKRDDVPGTVRQHVLALASDKSINLEAFSKDKLKKDVPRHVGTNMGPQGRGGRVRYA